MIANKIPYLNNINTMGGVSIPLNTAVVSDGSGAYVRKGNIVMVSLINIKFKAKGDSQILVSAADSPLPAPLIQPTFLFGGASGATSKIIGTADLGWMPYNSKAIYIHAQSDYYNQSHYGYFCYLTND